MDRRAETGLVHRASGRLRDALRRPAWSAASRLGVEHHARAARELLLPAEQRRDLRDTAMTHRLISWLLRHDDDAVDVGAHAGSVLAEIVRVAPQGRHVAVEPQPWLADALRRTFPAVEVLAAAASDTAGETTFQHAAGNPGWSGFRVRPAPNVSRFEELRVQTVRLDDVLADRRRPRLLKIDVEGAELEVLRGAAGCLAEFQPWVVFEHGLGAADFYGTSPDDVFELLVDGAGLRIFDLDGHGPHPLPVFRRLFETGAKVNFVAHR